MGLPGIQILPGDVQCSIEEVISPTTFFSTLDSIVGDQTAQNDYEILPLEELEVGLTTEVSTTDANEGEVFHGDLPVLEDGNAGESETETESADPENQICWEVEHSYSGNILEEIVDGTDSYSKTDINCNALQNTGNSVNVNNGLQTDSFNLNELVCDIDNDDLVMSWLSSLNGVVAVGDVSPSLPVDRMDSADVPQAKDELRSFILARKTKPIEEINERRSSSLQYDLRSRNESASMSRRKRPKSDEFEEEDYERLRLKQERNRVAAKKCRQKRTKLAEDLTKESERLKQENDELTLEVKDLTKELRMLQDVVLDHDLHMINSQCRDRLSTSIFSSGFNEFL